MNKVVGLRFQAILFGAIVLVAAASHVALRDRHARERTKLGKIAAGARSREIAAEWRTLPYTSVMQAGLTDAFLAKIDWAVLNLSEIQRTKLQSKLGQMLAYLISPTCEDYYRLKTEGLSYQFKASGWVTAILTGAVEHNGLGSPPVRRSASASGSSDHAESADLSATRAMWEKLYGSSNELASGRVTGIFLEHIAVATTSTNSAATLLKGRVRKEFTAAKEMPNLGFEYPGLNHQPLAHDSESLFFQISFFAQANGTNNAGPVFLCLGWLPWGDGVVQVKSRQCPIRDRSQCHNSLAA